MDIRFIVDRKVWLEIKDINRVVWKMMTNHDLRHTSFVNVYSIVQSTISDIAVDSIRGYIENKLDDYEL